MTTADMVGVAVVGVVVVAGAVTAVVVLKRDAAGAADGARFDGGARERAAAGLVAPPAQPAAQSGGQGGGWLADLNAGANAVGGLVKTGASLWSGLSNALASF